MNRGGPPEDARGLVLRVLTALLPGDFRSSFEGEIRWTQHRRLEAAKAEGRRGRMWRAEVADACRTLCREWAAVVMERGRGERRDEGRLEMGVFVQELRLAVRSLWRNPGFAVTSVAMLSIGIGACAAIFTVVDTVLLRPLPWEGGDRLTIVWGRSVDSDDVLRSWLSYPDFVDLEASQTEFEELGAFRAGPVTILGDDGEPASVQAVYGTHSLFPVAGVEPELGRTFDESEDRVGGPRVVMLSHATWRDRFGSDEGILGRTVVVDGDPHAIVGVMPRDYRWPLRTDLWLPAAQNVGQDSRGMHRLRVRARLREGATFDSATRSLEGIGTRLAAAYPDTNDDVTFWAESLQEALVTDSRDTLLTLLGAVFFVLLIVCANIANLLLTRATGRYRDVAVRVALGAGRGRLLTQYLAEGLLLGAIGGALGLALGHALLDVLVAMAPPGAIPRVAEVALDLRVVAVVGACALATALLFGLVPALAVRRARVSAALRDGGSRQGSLRGARLRMGLVVLETGLALALAFGSALLVRSFQAVEDVDAGFDPQDLWAVPIVLPFAQYEGARWPAVLSLFESALTEARSTPGVAAAALAYAPPTRPSWTTGFTVEGQPPPDPSDRPEAAYRPVSPGYFAAAGVPFVAGRDFTEGDDASAPGAVIVNEAFVRTHFPGQRAVGRVIVKESWWEGTPEGAWTIVGVVEDVAFTGRETGARPAFYFPHAQRPMTEMFLMIRTDRDLAQVLPRVRQAVWRNDPTIPLDNVLGMSGELAQSLSGRRFSAGLMSAFGLVAMLLAAGGLFSVLSYTVSRRTHEMGVRMSLGAGASDVRRLVLRQAALLTAGGIALGSVAAFALGRSIESMLFGVGAADPATLMIVSLPLVGCSLLASYLPARRATRVDPVRALGSE